MSLFTIKQENHTSNDAFNYLKIGHPIEPNYTLETCYFLKFV